MTDNNAEFDNETNQFENFAVDSVTTDTLETTTEHIDQIHDFVGQSGMDESYLSVNKMRIKTGRGVLLITAEDGKLEVREEDD
jgi:hypothetical protein